MSLRIGKPASTFESLQKKVWTNIKLAIKKKFYIYNVCVLTPLLYGSEENTMQAPARCVRKILVIKWFSKVTNVEVLTRAHLESINTGLRKRRLHCIGHI